MRIIKQLKSRLHQEVLIIVWALARLIVKNDPPTIGAPIVHLIPSDPVHLVGSLGDEAMMTAVWSETSRKVDGRRFAVSVASDVAKNIAEGREMIPVPYCSGPLMPLRYLRQLKLLKPRWLFVMGADMMDGHYSPVIALRMIIAADLAARSGTTATFLGFSFNRNPTPAIIRAFRRMSPEVGLNLRDENSWGRFSGLVGYDGHLVADTAFLLLPKLSSQKGHQVTEWAIGQRRAGRLVIAVNFHPLLFKSDALSKTDALSKSLSACLSNVSASYQVSWLLLPHDNRATDGDIQPLSALNALLPASVRSNVFLLDSTLPAAEVKALCAHLDGVISGRMHLAIAALGMGVPVLLFDYQDKFSGLIAHFGLDSNLVLDPEGCIDSGYLLKQALAFVENIGAIRSAVKSRLPSVLELAAKNYAQMPA